MTKPQGRVSLGVAIVALLASIRRTLSEMQEENMANFEKVDEALAELTDKIDAIEALPAVEDPAVQAKIDEIAGSINDAAARIGTLIADREPHPDQTLPGDLPQS
jgi:chromosome segregation ATPase